jgi:hypothetical protein
VVVILMRLVAVDRGEDKDFWGSEEEVMRRRLLC